jgi:hypothetical protein
VLSHDLSIYFAFSSDDTRIATAQGAFNRAIRIGEVPKMDYQQSPIHSVQVTDTDDSAFQTLLWLPVDRRNEFPRLPNMLVICSRGALVLPQTSSWLENPGTNVMALLVMHSYLSSFVHRILFGYSPKFSYNLT